MQSVASPPALNTHEPTLGQGSVSVKSVAKPLVLNPLFHHQKAPAGEKPLSARTVADSERCTFIRGQSIHTGERPWLCKGCGRASHGSSQLIHHQLLRPRETLPYRGWEKLHSEPKPCQYQKVRSREKAHPWKQCGKALGQKAVCSSMTSPSLPLQDRSVSDSSFQVSVAPDGLGRQDWGWGVGGGPAPPTVCGPERCFGAFLFSCNLGPWYFLWTLAGILRQRGKLQVEEEVERGEKQRRGQEGKAAKGSPGRERRGRCFGSVFKYSQLPRKK